MTVKLSAIAVCLCLTTSAVAQPATPPEDATSVSDVVVSAPPSEVPVPEVGEGAPYYSVQHLDRLRQGPTDQVAQQIRANLAGGKTGGFALMEAMNRRGRLVVARRATAYADQVRREAAQGLRTQKEVEDAELARQIAVRRAVGATRRAPRLDAVRSPPSPMVIDNFVARLESLDRGRARLVVAGSLRNITQATVKAPNLNIIALDAQGFVIAQKEFDPGVRIESGRSRAFAYFFPDPPAQLKDVRVGLVIRPEG